MERRVWAFALVSVALQLSLDDSVVKDARVVLGGVAPRPWRLFGAEALLQNRRVTPEVIGQVAEDAVSGAKPLKQNHYKLPLIKGMLAEVFSEITGIK